MNAETEDRTLKLSIPVLDLAFGLLMMSTFLNNASTATTQMNCFRGNSQAYSLAIVCLLFVAALSSGCSTLLGKTKGPMDNQIGRAHV